MNRSAIGVMTLKHPQPTRITVRQAGDALLRESRRTRRGSAAAAARGVILQSEDFDLCELERVGGFQLLENETDSGDRRGV